MRKKFIRNKKARYAAVSVALTVMVIVVAVLANAVLTSLVERYSLYAYLTPVEAEYACVWYNEAGILLSTSKTYKVREVDVGHVIHVRIQGTGVYTGFVADGTTAAVKAAP